RAEEVASAIRASGGMARAVRLDISDAASVNAVVGGLLEELGRVDLLVNNAGVTRDNLMLRLKPDDWDAVMNTNLRGSFHVTRAVLGSMVRRRWGRIVSIASVVGQMGNAGQTNYAASKAGL